MQGFQPARQPSPQGCPALTCQLNNKIIERKGFFQYKLGHEFMTQKALKKEGFIPLFQYRAQAHASLKYSLRNS